MPKFEIEIKSLLGSEENTNQLLNLIKSLDKNLTLTSKNHQLNHYFIGGDITKLNVLIHDYLNEQELQDFHHIVNHGENISVRTRQMDSTVILVIKASLDDTSSSNGTARIEFEKIFGKNTSLDQLDQILLNANFQYQAKWSRQRTEYLFHVPTDFKPSVTLSNQPEAINLCIDKNAGYGYILEFEIILDQTDESDIGKQYLRELMNFLNIIELSQERLERMFTFYNQHWSEYYGTDKTFDIQ